MEKTIWAGDVYTTTLTPTANYNVDSQSVSKDGSALEQGTQYTYSDTSGIMTFSTANTNKGIDIIASAVPKTYALTHDLNNITTNSSATTVTYNTDYTETLTPKTGYTIPSEITIMRGNKVLPTTEYTLTPSGNTLKVTIPGAKITDDIEIIATAVKEGAQNYTLTIYYNYQDGTTAYTTYTKELASGDTYSVSSPSITGYTADVTKVAGTMDTVNVERTVTYYKNQGSATLPEGAGQDNQTGSGDVWVPAQETDSDGNPIYKDATSNIAVTVKCQDESRTVNGITTYALQILSVTGGNANTGYNFKVNDIYQEYFDTLLGKSNVPVTEVISYLQALDTNDKVNEFIDSIYAYSLNKNIQSVDQDTGTTGSTQLNLDCSRRYSSLYSYYAGAGYYLFVSEGTLGDQSTLQLVTRDTTVYLKSGEMTIDKVVDKPSHNIGEETANYTLTSTIPNLKNVRAGYRFEMYDVVSKGVTINVDSIRVSTDSDTLVAGDDYIVTQSTTTNANDTIAIKLDFDNGTHLNNNQKKGEKVEVTYSATVNEEAIIGSAANENIAYLRYSNNPYFNTDEVTDTEESVALVYTYALNITKYDGKGSNRHTLAGASFQIKNSNNEILKFVQKDDKSYCLATADNAAAVDTIVTQENGKLIVYGLNEGDYTVTETQAPTGYQVIAPFTLRISGEYNDKGVLQSFSGSLGGNTDMVTLTKTSKDEGMLYFDIVDPTIGTDSLPGTGGMGRTIIYVAGSLILLLAVVLLVIRSKKRRD
jgi:hypothetical protein